MGNKKRNAKWSWGGIEGVCKIKRIEIPPYSFGDEPTPIAANDNAPLNDWFKPEPPHSVVSRRNLPLVIALTGPAGSGKSTAARHLVNAHGYALVKFAGPLKSMMRMVGLSDREIEGDLKEEPSAVLCGRTPRYAMQTLGTEWGRDIIGPDFWANVWFEVAAEVLDQGGRVVCDDCRFDNEAEAVRKLGGLVLSLHGRGGIEGDHASEAGGVKADFSICNDNKWDAGLTSQLDALLCGYQLGAAAA